VKRLTLAAAAVLLVGLAGCGDEDREGASSATTTTVERYTMTGRFVLQGEAGDADTEYEKASGLGLACAGTGGYDDIEGGLEVTVRDANDTIIGDSALSEGAALADGCSFDFKVPNLPRTTFYKVKVGNRGEQNYSFDEMKAAGWHISLSLG
jgi:hypothetical protein